MHIHRASLTGSSTSSWPELPPSRSKNVGKTATAERALGLTTVSLQALLTGARAPLHGETTVGLAQYTHEILASGLPGLRGRSGSTLRAQLDGYLAEARLRHLRTTDGRHEVDLIIERADQRIVAFEVKLATHIDDRDVRHLRWLQQQLGEDLLDAAIITTGSHAYRCPDGIAVIPAALLTA